jgi:hypothetical protein
MKLGVLFKKFSSKMFSSSYMYGFEKEAAISPTLFLLC